MKIYGVALLAGCFLIGKFTGYALGMFINIEGDIGGVGFAMIYLITINSFMKKKGLLKKETRRGILFWGTMYIPIVIAMSATQNVKAAWAGGWIALLVGIVVVLLIFLFVPIISKIGNKKEPIKL
ncbi:malonate transporter subunit MadL [Mariniflexile jejuense]|uniref:Malonate transporter subunit MadL n=1 Tax=Mariniflexile jejuense TaxID=1173582 RepID=A0ABW3JNR2_9FLAO